MHNASFHGHVDLAQFLVERGADVSAKDKSLMTPLHKGSYSNHAGLVRFLVEHGADPDVSGGKDSCRRWTPLHFASRVT